MGAFKVSTPGATSSIVSSSLYVSSISFLPPLTTFASALALADSNRTGCATDSNGFSFTIAALYRFPIFGTPPFVGRSISSLLMSHIASSRVDLAATSDREHFSHSSMQLHVYAHARAYARYLLLCVSFANFLNRGQMQIVNSGRPDK